MPFKTSEQSFRSHQHLFRDRKLFCSAGNGAFANAPLPFSGAG